MIKKNWHSAKAEVLKTYPDAHSHQNSHGWKYHIINHGQIIGKGSTAYSAWLHAERNIKEKEND